MKQVCRACLLKLEENNSNAIVHKLVFIDVTSIQIEDDDEFPKALCDGCVCKLLYFKEFKQLCCESDDYLKRSNDIDPAELCHVEEIKIEYFNTEYEQPVSDNTALGSSSTPSTKNTTAKNEHLNIKKRVHNCPQADCNQSFDTLTRLNAHQNTHQNDKKMKTTSTNHQSSAQGNKKHINSQCSCQLCGQTFSVKASLVKHCKNVHKIEPEEIERIVSADNDGFDTKTETKEKIGIKRKVESTTSSEESENDNHYSEKDQAISERQNKGMKIESSTDQKEMDSNAVKCKNKYRCPRKGCKKSLSSLQQLEDHESCHRRKENAGKPPTLLWSNQCIVCKIRLEDAETLQSHLTTHEEEENTVFMCDICERPLKNSNTLRRHRRTHQPKEERLVNCSVCDKKVLKITISEHMYRKHREIEKQVCPVCGVSMTPRDLKQHKNTHETGEEYQCVQCPRVFKTKMKCWVHQSTAHRKKVVSVPCIVCGKTFKSNDLLKKHCINLHTVYTTTENIFACKQCDVKCKTNISLRQHEKIVHSGERKYACPLCPMTFAQAVVLKRHAYVHSGERPAHCEICNKGFYTNFALKIHMNIHKRQWIAEGVQGIELQKYPSTKKKTAKNERDDDYD